MILRALDILEDKGLDHLAMSKGKVCAEVLSRYIWDFPFHQARKGVSRPIKACPLR